MTADANAQSLGEVARELAVIKTWVSGRRADKIEDLRRKVLDLAGLTDGEGGTLTDAGDGNPPRLGEPANQAYDPTP